MTTAPPTAAATPETGGTHRHLGVALFVIALAQLMVVLDATIVNVALPHITKDLGFSNAGQQWIITAYTLAFGGLLLLGGRMGDLLGRRRVFMFGSGLFAFGSLLGGFAQNQGWLLAARAVQGIGGAIMAPTALALITITFPQGPPRNRAMGVYAAMSGIGASIGLILGGVLTSYLNWRWVLFVNVPIAAVLLILAPGSLNESERHPGRFDLPGALLSTIGFASLVYGLTNGATDPSGKAHWTDTNTIVALILAVACLLGFMLVESRSPHALMPFDIFKNGSRSAAYAVSLCLGTAMFGLFFFLTLFVQNVLGYSAVKAGFAFLPFSIFIMISAGGSSNLVAKTGPRPWIIPGLAFGTVGMFLFTRLNVHSSYIGGLLPPMIITALGLGAVFVPMTLVALTKIRDDEAGIASGVLNVGQQIGGSIGLASIGTIAWSQFAAYAHVHNLKQSDAGSPVYKEALTSGFGRGFFVASCIMFVALLITIVFIKTRKEDIGHIDPMSAGAV
jgi:EmrB/QacA subfamily drug resistance transporter